MFLKLLTISALLLPFGVNAQSSSYEELPMEDTAWVFVGGDAGFALLETQVDQEIDKIGFQLDAKARLAYYLEDFVFDLGFGWAFNRLKGDSDIGNRVQETVKTRTLFFEVGPRFRITKNWDVGLLYQGLFGTNTSFGTEDLKRSDYTSLAGLETQYLIDLDKTVLRLTASALTDLDLESRQTLQVLLGFQFGIPVYRWNRSGAEIELKVRDSETNEAISGAQIRLTGQESLAKITDREGEGEFNDLSAGSYTIVVSNEGYDSYKEVIQIEDGSDQDKIIPLKALGASGISGRVVNEEGTPLSAKIKVENKEYISDPETGRFKTDSLTPGFYSVDANSQSYVPATIETEVVRGKYVPINFILKKPSEVQMLKNKVILPEPIYFEFNSDKIEARSFPILDQVVEVYKQHDSAPIILVGGHTDSVGAAAYNLGLSQRRARSVRDYLITKGLPRETLQAEGYGESKPISSNKTKKGRAENRRVEFLLKDN